MFYPTIGITEMVFGTGRIMTALSSGPDETGAWVVTIHDTQRQNKIGDVPREDIEYRQVSENSWEYDPKFGDVILRFEGPNAEAKATAVNAALTMMA